MAYMNCPQCGKLMSERKDSELLCKACEALADSPYQRVRDYVYHHQGATIIEVSEVTGVSKSLILQYLKEERISLMEERSLLSRCEKCGCVIDRGYQCSDCMKASLRKSDTNTQQSSGFGGDKKAVVTKFGRRTRR